MTKLFTIAFIFFVLGCNPNNSTQKFLPPDKTDINEIVEVVVNQNSLPFRDTSIIKPTPLSTDLRKVRVIVPDNSQGLPPPIDHTTISIFDLFNSSVNNHSFFDRADSSYFLYQNTSIKTFSIDRTITEKLVVKTTFAEQKRENDSKSPVYYYDLTIPILSADNKKAYIQWTTNCSGCGGATAFYLEKIKNNWVIINSEVIWRN